MIKEVREQFSEAVEYSRKDFTVDPFFMAIIMVQQKMIERLRVEVENPSVGCGGVVGCGSRCGLLLKSSERRGCSNYLHGFESEPWNTPHHFAQCYHHPRWRRSQLFG
jgi:hypothetical protein